MVRLTPIDSPDLTGWPQTVRIVALVEAPMGVYPALYDLDNQSGGWPGI